MAEASKRRKGPKAVPSPPPEPEPQAGSGDEATAHAGTCPVAWCPICLAVSVVQPIRPEAVEHLLRAGSELFLAMRAVVDARADEVERKDDDASPSGGLEKIDIG